MMHEDYIEDNNHSSYALQQARPGRPLGSILTSTTTRVPITNQMESAPVFVNAKQYHNILRRRKKKEKLNKLRNPPKGKLKKKFRYHSRSNHAINRKRDRDGKFISKKKEQDDDRRSESTELRQQDEIIEPDPPCCAEEDKEPPIKPEGEDNQRQSGSNSKKKQNPLEDEEDQQANLEIFEQFKPLSKKTSKREDPMEESINLMRNDSFFDTKLDNSNNRNT